jgi:hypothetical protein
MLVFDHTRAHAQLLLLLPLVRWLLLLPQVWQAA